MLFRFVWGVSALASRLKRQRRKRFATQAAAFLLGNANLPGFITGTIYQGSLKQICLPGLNCYSCPGALGACPLGGLQNGLADPLWRIPLYVLGFLMLIGILLGRFVCGWLCPFGWFQELLHRIGWPSRRNKWRPTADLPLHRLLLHGKTVMLAVLVVSVPLMIRWLTGYGIPAFCTYFCPSGTLMAGIPLLLANSQLRELTGWVFSWKMSVLLAVILLSLWINRPFCRYLCPLGAIYGWMNRFSFYRITVDENLCTRCGICTRHCPMSAPIPFDGNDSSCIRCGECVQVCPQNAIVCGFSRQAVQPVKKKAE